MATVDLNPDLYALAQAFAAATGRTVSEVVEDAVRQKVTPPLPPVTTEFKLVSFGIGGVLPGIDLNDNSAVLDIMDDGGVVS